mmetsp:Transcript_22807/g.34558  ORF Transcript_22807/g.34558 Transcript_22807/m.34558 type:complete len:93 (-) Transcript_22807:2293-2571(-)
MFAFSCSLNNNIPPSFTSSLADLAMSQFGSNPAANTANRSSKILSYHAYQNVLCFQMDTDHRNLMKLSPLLLHSCVASAAIQRPHRLPCHYG